MEEVNKTISITGTNNKYQMKKLINKKDLNSEPKKRIVAEKWMFSNETFEYTRQMRMINDIFILNSEKQEGIENESKTDDDVIKIAIQQINKKIYSYKQQDILKNKLDTNNFITFKSVIQKMIECELNCRYCKEHMNVLYDISREMKQWSVDRIDNNLGHNIDNFHLACLDCNLKRRRRTDEKFLFTKQLNIVKQDNSL
jgi:hypothetical protein